MPTRRPPEGPPAVVFLLLAGAVAVYLYTAGGRTPDPGPVRATPDTRTAVAARLAALAVAPERREAILGDVAARLAAAPEGPGAAIRDLLDTGVDAATGDTFRVGPRGIEATATLRGWLHDAWHRLDADGAREHAPAYAARAVQAEEWAVALRNAVAGDPARARSPSVRAALEAGHARTDWRDDPAFLEAVDILVLAGEPADLEALSALGTGAADDLRHAVLLGADRLLAQRGDAVVGHLAANPGLFAWRHGVRGALLARADTARPAQQNAVRAFLLAADPAEAAAFLSLYPLHHYAIGPALSSRPALPGLAAVAASDARARNDVGAWLADAAFARHRALLLGAQARLEAAGASAARGGFATTPPVP